MVFQTISNNYSKPELPIWVGLFLCMLTLEIFYLVWNLEIPTEWLSSRKRRELLKQYPGSKAYEDYPWNPNGINKPNPWVLAVKTQGFFVFGWFTFMVSATWWGWFSRDSILITQLFVSVFDIFLILMIIVLIKDILKEQRYDKNSSLEYDMLPFHLGGQADVL